jgi:hypothetical protein
MPQQERDKKRKVRNVRMTEQEHEDVLQRASEAGTEFSAYVRACALGRPAPSRSRQKQINELRRLGGLIKHMYNEGLHERANIDPRNFMLLLAEIRMAIHRTEAASE